MRDVVWINILGGLRLVLSHYDYVFSLNEIGGYLDYIPKQHVEMMRNKITLIYFKVRSYHYLACLL